MPRVASALAKLSQHDATLERPGRLSNRPKRSLEGLLRWALPQTLASADARVGEMRRRLVETPNVGFPLLVAQIANLGMAILYPSQTPKLRVVEIPSHTNQEARSHEEAPRLLGHFLDILLDYLGQDAALWAYVLRHVRMHRTDLAVPILNRLEREQAQIHDDEALVWMGTG